MSDSLIYTENGFQRVSRTAILAHNMHFMFWSLWMCRWRYRNCDPSASRRLRLCRSGLMRFECITYKSKVQKYCIYLRRCQIISANMDGFGNLAPKCIKSCLSQKIWKIHMEGGWSGTMGKNYDHLTLEKLCICAYVLTVVLHLLLTSYRYLLF